MTATSLRNYTCKDLAQMARTEGVEGWHAMRKDQLIDALVRAARLRQRRKSSGKPVDSKSNGVRPKPTEDPALTAARRMAQHRIAALHRRNSELKNLAGADGQPEVAADRLVVMVRDPYWLHATWELSPQSINRAQTALGQHWHVAKPVLRLHRLQADGSSGVMREIAVHGGVQHWYIDVDQPPCSFRVEIGYATSTGKFYCIARSNTVGTPAPSAAETVDRNWVDVAENADRIFAMSGGYSAHGASAELQELLEQRLRRRLGRPSETRFGAGAAALADNELRLALDAELVVYGVTDPHSHVTVLGEPVSVDANGAFALKLHLPDRRQVVTVVASSADGVQQKTVILGVERNTKELDPLIRDATTAWQD